MSITGRDLQSMSDEDIVQACRTHHIIFSRTAPQDKLRIVSALKDAGEVVAVTGDGINDAPALKKADIGVAMGITGTDVAKDASALILLQDNFSDLVTAIREGRIIFTNITKTIYSSLTSNGGELWIVLLSLVGAGIRGRPIAITPLLILCIDLVGEMLPLTALTRDPARTSLMTQSPRDVNQHLLRRSTLIDLLWSGFLM
jgi:Ca2+-transporting ATPase